MTVLVWLAIALGCLVALLLLVVALLLLVPVALDAVWGEERRTVSLSGPGLRVSFDAPTRSVEVRLMSRRIGRWSSTGGRPRRGRRRPRRRTPRPSLSRLWRERGTVVAALRAFLRRLRVRRLSLRATLATPDPALTGWLTGAAFAVRAVAPLGVRRGLQLEPDFTAESPSLALDASLRLRPVHAAVLGVRLWRVSRRARPPRGAAEGPGPVGWAARGLSRARRAAARVRGGGRGSRATEGTDGSPGPRHDAGTNRPEGGRRE